MDKMKEIVERFNLETCKVTLAYQSGLITYEEMLTKKLDILKKCQSEAWVYVVDVS